MQGRTTLLWYQIEAISTPLDPIAMRSSAMDAQVRPPVFLGDTYASSAYVRIRQNTSAYVSIRQHTAAAAPVFLGDRSPITAL
jgi:hypothetical protein